MIKQKFTIEYKLPSLNEITRGNRTHWSKGYKDKRDVEDSIGWSIVGAKIKPCERYPVEINIVYHEPNKRRDSDNVESSQKFILDALQRYNILAGDSPKYLAKAPNKTILYDCKEHYVEVEIIENDNKK